MPTVTIRLSATEKADLESAARREGQNVSEYVRGALDLRDDAAVQGLNVRVEALWEKVARLEEMAGL
jgi:DNA-binding transcriptional ArsR family regulator